MASASTNWDIPQDFELEGCTLKLNNPGAPEDYDVLTDGHLIGYLRVRGGTLKVYTPDIDGEIILEIPIDPKLARNPTYRSYEGCFLNGKDRELYLSNAVHLCLDAYHKSRQT